MMSKKKRLAIQYDWWFQSYYFFAIPLLVELFNAISLSLSEFASKMVFQ